jgi:hypothetical protein
MWKKIGHRTAKEILKKIMGGDSISDCKSTVIERVQ